MTEAGFWCRSVRRVAAAAVLCASAVGQVFASVPDVTDPAVVEAFVDGAVIPTMEKHHSPSGVVAVMKDGKVILEKGYGYIDVEKRIPVDASESMFRPGSISKLFTWIAVMQQVEQGKLDLDVDVNTYLETFQVEDTYPGQPVTLRHVLTHTAGFEDGAVGYLIIDDPERIMPLAEALAHYQPARVTAPGERVAYSNWATTLAGHIVANVSGLSFNDYVQTHIFDVLGMTHSTFVEPLPASLEPFMAKAYLFEAGEYVETPYEIVANFGPAGAAAVSARDMTFFARALLHDGAWEGRRILKPQTLQQMLDEGFVHDDRVRGVGLGFLKREYGPEGFDNYGHDGSTTRFNSHFGLSKSEDFMLFSSFSGPNGGAVHQHFVKAFYDEFFPRPAPKLEPPADFAERAAGFAGIYNSSRGSFTKIEAIMRPLGGMKVVPMPDNTLLVGDTRYVEEERNLFRAQYGTERIAFQQAEDGTIEGFVMDGLGVFQFYRVPFYESADFTLLLIGLSLLVSVLVVLRLAYQRREVRVAGSAEQRAEYTSLAFALLTLGFYGLVGVAVSGGLEGLFYALPASLKFSLVFPLLLVPVVLYHFYQCVQVWREGLFQGLWPRIRYSIVTLVALLGLWFYYFWNLLGFNYLV
ncbi:serine hydrolase domain-containing protein [Parahaliea aestuarii]|uniref:Beta-lactamase family protein n=1 Tax=Parahaliea aestuarii TaxID=1852021 RepID=A0A5C8ZLM6_9GAMM|nr:serine hydrolase domain-containing protein [Parahaliea aestuarii]TXS89373.1 beta-lactamase family protein [Parahaliea aestuarii]